MAVETRVGTNLFKLEKLKVQAFSSSKREGEPIDELVAMFNPESIKKSQSIEWSVEGKVGKYNRKLPADLDLNLIIDGTIVTGLGPMSPQEQETVEERVKRFMAMAVDINGTIHQPNYLLVSWGDMVNLKCRVKSVSITYSTFDRNGVALRAELAVSFMADGDPEEEARSNELSSPDLTHTRMVCAGDTLPLLTREIYGSATHYLEVARYNDLDHFRRLEPGSRLAFPPLELLLAESSAQEPVS